VAKGSFSRRSDLSLDDGAENIEFGLLARGLLPPARRAVSDDCSG